MGIRLCSLWNSFINPGVLLLELGGLSALPFSPLQNLFLPVLNIHYPQHSGCAPYIRWNGAIAQISFTRLPSLCFTSALIRSLSIKVQRQQ